MPKKTKTVKKTAVKKGKAEAQKSEARVLSTKVVYRGPLFRVTKDRVASPSGLESVLDVVRHNGSVVILALDHAKGKQAKNKKDPWVVVERQYRHAAGQTLWELPAGKLEPGEDALEGAKRELAEETGYRAKKWAPLAEFWASPGFLGESMKIFVAEELTAGETHFDPDEEIDLRLVKLSDVLKKIEKGGIVDGKTLVGVMLYERLRRGKKK